MFNSTNFRLPIICSILILVLLLLAQPPTHVAHAQNGTEDNYFNVPRIGFEDEVITLEWHVAGANNIKIEHINGLSLLDPTQINNSFNNLLPTGNLTFTLDQGQRYIPLPPHVDPPGRYAYSADFILTADGDTFERFVSVMCGYEFFFSEPVEPSHSEKCVPEPRVFQAAYQQFENGFMLFDSSSGYSDVIRVYTSHDNGSNTGNQSTIQDTFEHGVDIVSDPTIIPPPGKYQPEYGFGKIWRENEWLRDRLGWATSPAVDYESVIQEGHRGGVIPDTGGAYSSQNYTRLPDGSLLVHGQHGGSYPDLVVPFTYIDHQSNGYAHPTNGIRVRQTNSNPSPNPPNGGNDEATPPTPATDGVPCPAVGVWPVGCNPNVPPSTNTPVPPTNGAVPCPTSGVWPAGCDPNLSPETNPPTPPVNGVPCPASGVWPAGCIPNGGGTPTPSGNDCVIPERGPWPPCATAGDPPPANTADDCIIPPSGQWPACARGGY